MKRIRILTVFGTRPEAVKLAPLLDLLSRDPRFESRACNTAQHREMLGPILRLFRIAPNYNLGVMRRGPSLAGLTAAILERLGPVLAECRPDVVLTQGDTTTTFAATLASYYQKIPVAHVEAGLRTGDLYRPFPEEANRRLTSRLASLHFTATRENARNLRAEGVASGDIVVAGNPVIDALRMIRARLSAQPPRWTGRLGTALEDPAARIVLVTGHRRENFGQGLQNLCSALVRLAREPNVLIVYPVHLNPNVLEPVRQRLAEVHNVVLSRPLDYERFVHLMTRAHFVLTDSGGIQEEAPALGKPVLVMREITERPEALASGAAKLIGSKAEAIVSESLRLLRDPRAYRRMAATRSPFGDGRAAKRIVSALKRRFG